MMSPLAVIFFLLTLLSLWLIYRHLIRLKATEKKLRESEKFLKTIIDAEPECIKLIAADGTLLMMNLAGLAMLEADSLDQVKGHCTYNLIAPEYRGAFTSLTEDVFKGKSGILEFEAIGLKGKHIWLETNAVPLYNDTAEIIASLSITRNITGRKKAADALRAAHEELEQKVEERTFKLGLANKALQEGHSRLIAVMNSIDATVYVADMETHELLFINEYVKGRYGDILGKKCWQTLQQGQDGPCAFCTNDKLIGPDGEPTGVYQWEFCDRVNGRWYDRSDRAIRWLDGKLKRMEIATDVTERKQAEEDLLATQQELLEAQRIAHLGHWELDLQTGKGKWSDESYRIFGFEPGAFEPTFIKFIDSVHPTDRKVVESYFPDLLLGKYSQVELDLRIIRPFGEERIINTKLEVISDKNGKPFKLSGITLDITERKRAEEERERLIKELQDAISQVKTLSGMLPICSSCKKIRDDKGYWTQIESYIRAHSEAKFSHSMCPDCVKKLYPEFCDKIIENKEIKEADSE